MKQVFKKIIIQILTVEAKFALKKHKPIVIAVTGSVGKTSTKDGIFEILNPITTVRKSEKSFNGDIGVPITILGLPTAWGSSLGWIKNCFVGIATIFSKKYPKYLILEVGADHPRDISSIAKWIKPTYSIFTHFPDVPVHVEFFENKNAVIKEKKTLALYTRKKGALILNADDAVVLHMKNEYPQESLTYGTNTSALVRLAGFHVVKKQGMYTGEGMIVFQSGSPHASYSFSLPRIIAPTQVASVLPAIAIALREGFSFTEATQGITHLLPTPGRLSTLRGLHNTILIDDTYNASPAAVVNALSCLKTLPEARRKIAVLGDMMELGTYTEEEHRKIGKHALQVVDILLCVGIRSKFMYEEARRGQGETSKIHSVMWFEDSVSAGEYVQSILREGDVVLFKGSQSTRMERAIIGCLLHETDRSLLVRQEKEWQNNK